MELAADAVQGHFQIPERRGAVTPKGDRCSAVAQRVSVLVDLGLMARIDKPLGDGESSDSGPDDENSHRLHPFTKCAGTPSLCGATGSTDLSFVTTRDRHRANRPVPYRLASTETTECNGVGARSSH